MQKHSVHPQPTTNQVLQGQLLGHSKLKVADWIFVALFNLKTLVPVPDPH